MELSTIVFDNFSHFSDMIFAISEWMDGETLLDHTLAPFTLPTSSQPHPSPQPLATTTSLDIFSSVGESLPRLDAPSPSVSNNQPPSPPSMDAPVSATAEVEDATIRSLFWVPMVVDALAYLNDRGVVHHQLHPSNILIHVTFILS